MSDSAFPHKYLVPSELPQEPTALDAWILRGKNIILSKKHNADDQIINLTFEGFQQTIQEVFHQTLTIEVTEYNRCLVIKDGVFAFIPMDAAETYLAQNNPLLNQVSTLLSQILAQELNFLTQLNTFQNMLQSTDVFTTPETLVLTPTNLRPKRDIPLKPKPITRKHSVTKRSILDIFTPYSLSHVGDTANENYKAMNRNFEDVHDTELKLSHQQTVLFTNFHDLTDEQRDTSRKELYLELQSLKSRYYGNFIFSLEQILESNRLD